MIKLIKHVESFTKGTQEVFRRIPTPHRASRLLHLHASVNSSTTGGATEINPFADSAATKKPK
jgi:hypothetical protein